MVLVPPSLPVPPPDSDEDINGNGEVVAADYTLWANDFWPDT